MHVCMQGLQCQHGPLECRLNRLFACAIDQSKTQEDYWPFVECVESNYGDKIEDSLKGCAKDNAFSLKDLEDCASGRLHVNSHSHWATLCTTFVQAVPC